MTSSSSSVDPTVKLSIYRTTIKPKNKKETIKPEDEEKTIQNIKNDYDIIFLDYENPPPDEKNKNLDFHIKSFKRKVKTPTIQNPEFRYGKVFLKKNKFDSYKAVPLFTKSYFQEKASKYQFRITYIDPAHHAQLGNFADSINNLGLGIIFTTSQNTMVLPHSYSGNKGIFVKSGEKFSSIINVSSPGNYTTAEVTLTKSKDTSVSKRTTQEKLHKLERKETTLHLEGTEEASVNCLEKPRTRKPSILTHLFLSKSFAKMIGAVVLIILSVVLFRKSFGISLLKPSKNG